MAAAEGGICPTCLLKLPLSELEAHAQTHFGLSQSDSEPTLIGDDAPSVSCIQCGAEIPLDQYASHERAHRCCIPFKRTGSGSHQSKVEDVKLMKFSGFGTGFPDGLFGMSGTRDALSRT